MWARYSDTIQCIGTTVCAVLQTNLISVVWQASGQPLTVNGIEGLSMRIVDRPTGFDCEAIVRDSDEDRDRFLDKVDVSACGRLQ